MRQIPNLGSKTIEVRALVAHCHSPTHSVRTRLHLSRTQPDVKTLLRSQGTILTNSNCCAKLQAYQRTSWNLQLVLFENNWPRSHCRQWKTNLCPFAKRNQAAQLFMCTRLHYNSACTLAGFTLVSVLDCLALALNSFCLFIL